MKIKLDHNIHIVFYNLNNSYPHLLMQELRKFDFTIKIMPNGLEKYMNQS